MQRSGADGKEGDPVAVEHGHLTQRLAGQRGLVQVMLLFEQASKLRPLVLVEQAARDV